MNILNEMEVKSVKENKDEIIVITTGAKYARGGQNYFTTEAKALNKLRHPKRSKELRGFLDLSLSEE